MSDEWVKMDGDQIVILESAPDHIHEFFESDHEYAEALLNFHITCEAIGYDTYENTPEPHEWRDLKEQHMDSMVWAVREGDINTAQEELKHAELIEDVGKAVSAALMGDEQ